MYGYNGKVLLVNLTDKSYVIEDLPEEWAKQYLGGVTLGARYLYRLMKPHTPALAPESVLGIVCGVTNGSKAFMGARVSVVCKSPVNDLWNDSSCGGSFAPHLRASGFDAVFITGKSEKPCYLFLDDGKVEFRDASHLWGKVTSWVDDTLHEELGKDVSVFQIGPGGEHQSWMAAIINDKHRAAGRGGSGGVMGSKNLKAVVARGTHKIEIFNDAEIMAANKKCVAYGNPGERGENVMHQFRTTGTSEEYGVCVLAADAPLKNWAGAPDDMPEEYAWHLSGPEMDAKHKVGQTGCYNCHIRCGAIYKVDYKNYHLEHATRPEYESLGALGSMMLNGNSDVTVICNHLCNEYGYDTISCGDTLAWLMECYNKGIFTKEELGGIDFKWGDADAILAMMEKLCAYEGIGVPLQLGSRGCARKLGKGEECCVTANGIELPMHGGRFNPALIRTFQYDPTPGRHIKGGRGVPFSHNPDEVKYNYEGTGKDDVAGLLEWEWSGLVGVCSFGNFLLPPGAMLQMVYGVTGFQFTQEDLDKLSLRSFTMRHAFNLREGYRRKDFVIDGRAYGNPPMEKGPLTGITVDNEKLGDNFYAELGWDLETAEFPKEFCDKQGGLEYLYPDFFPNEV